MATALGLGSSQAAVTINDAQNNGTANGTTISDYAVNGSLSNTLLLVSVGMETSSDPAPNPTAGVSAISFGSSSLTLITEGSATRGYGALWALVNPSGTNDIAVTLSGQSPSGVAISAFTLAGVNTANPFGAFGSLVANSGGNAPSYTLPSLQSSDSLVISSLMDGNQRDYTQADNIGGNLDTLVSADKSSNGGLTLATASGPSTGVGNGFNSLYPNISNNTRWVMSSAEFNANSIPEPSMIGLSALGVLGLIGRRRR